MALIQTKREKMDETSAKNNGSYIPESSKSTGKRTYCILCRRSYAKHAEQEHMHSLSHHQQLETVLGKDSLHECHACKSFSRGIYQYAKHISTTQHEAKLKSLMSKNVKFPSMFKTLGTETISRILERNKKLKKEAKKVRGKKKKKLKQIAGQMRAEMIQGANQQTAVASRGLTLEISKQVHMRTLKQMQQIQQTGSNTAVVQNKENNVSRLQRPLHQRETALPNQSGKLSGLSGEPAGRTWHQGCVQDHYTESGQFIGVRGEHHRQYNTSTIDFTNDSYPHNFEYDYTGSSEPGPEGSHCFSNPASENKSDSATTVRDVDVSTMLRQIRRALGVREPCRADREARRQISQVGGGDTTQQASAATTSLQSSQVNTPATAAHSGVCPSSAAPAKPKHTISKVKKETTECSKKSSVVTGEGEFPEAFDSSTSLSQCAVNTTSTKPNPNITPRVRIAHKPNKTQGEPLIQGWFKSGVLPRKSGAKSWRDMYNDMKSKKQDNNTGMSRFGITLTNPQTDQESSSQLQDNEWPLSEGFHWESIPDSPSGPHMTVPPPPQDTTDTDSHRETQSDPQVQEPDTAQQVGGSSSSTVTATSVKTEPNLEDENGGLRDNSSAKKRKHNPVTDDGISDKGPSRKKKTKSNKDQNQMDQLLAVSLREDELSHSLQDLDKSLIQARNALQAAYTEVQRLMLLRQQFTAEVNSLRAKRIEILQGMQEGYLGASNTAEKAPTQQPRHSPLPSTSAFTTSSSQQTPATSSSPSSITQPLPTPLALPAVSVKNEICHPPTAGQTDTPHVPLNQPVPLFPSTLLPPLLLGPTHLAAPAATAVAASTSVNALLPPELCATQQVQEKKETLKGCVKEEARPVESDSAEETGRNLGKKQAKGRESAAEKSVPERDQKVSAAAPDDEDESDDSLEMMEPSNQEIIDIDESDNEDSPEPPQKSVRVEFSSASTQTFQKKEDDRQIPISLPVKNAETPAESVEDEEPSLGAFMNHSGPVHSLQVHDGLLYTCSGDNTARAYSLKNKECVAVFEGHTNKVNCLLVSTLPNMPARLYTGSSDQTIRCFSIKSKKCLEQISLPDRVLCLHIAWNTLYVGLANGSVASYDLKTLKQLDMLDCHGPRGVSCLGTAQEGARRVLLVGSYDSTISVRDAKSGLLLRSLEGHTKTVLCMKVVNDLVFSGSSDTSVHAHNIHTGELVRIYKGHGHAVTAIVILGKVMVTACLDKLVRVYELQSHDRLQVYGGHSDMVMCMAVHKSVIYTGCYDGSVQAVKLNLMKNCRCWWQNCSLIFGMAEHLVQHLTRDHSNPNLQAVRCRWRGCNTFFATQESVRQNLPEHMQSHVENNSKLQP
ncbi:LOW QUALITY PROTEIN: uncharacterized protein znf106b [Lates calcarifer]|uniref:LOW QUALITY PROTEIN: uncharacterized protein znf106b n=1 Tax=Lates calcarifer TaxID=8187 RepID=A0AAJ7VF42_LATCA|nr:LOW QUALITY PROTEIN: uncharacterized protein znf106b [Lates calcarifer]